MRSLTDPFRPWRLAALMAASALAPGASWAEAPREMQVTGLVPVPELDDGEEGDTPSPHLAVPSAVPAAGAPAEAAATGREPAEPSPAVPDLTALRADPVRGVPSSGFGWRDDPIRHRRRFHYGGDFRAPRGTPVYAAGGGTVTFRGRRHGYGKVIDVRHDGGLLTRYAHLSTIEVERGQHVDADALIGRVGSTGRTTGPHLHFEVRIEGRAVDPTEAMRVAELQRNEGPDASDVTRLAAVALRSGAGTAVSAIDPSAIAPRRREGACKRAHPAPPPSVS